MDNDCLFMPPHKTDRQADRKTGRHVDNPKLALEIRKGRFSHDEAHMSKIIQGNFSYLA